MGAGLFALMVAPRRPLVRHVYVLFPRQMEAPFDHTWPEDSYTSGPPPQGRSESEFFMTSSSSKIITRTLLTCFCNPSIMIGKESMSAAVLEAEQNGFVDLKNVLASLPSIGEQTVDSITENTILINNQCPNPRMKFIMERLIQHLHEFAKEVNLNTDEWIAGIRFLTETGQKCSDVRQEFILLSDILGLSTLVDGLSNSKPPGCTESTVLGPFHTEDAPPTEQGGSIVSSSGGKKMVVEGIVKNQNGEGIAGAQLDVWETDENGFYDVQNADRKGPDNRGIITTDESGKYQFEAIVPVSYPVPTDGPVAGLLKVLHRHCFRPAHIHFMIKAEGYESLTTSLYIKGDPFISSDAVFGVKNSLIVDVTENSPDASHPTKWWLLKYDFILPTRQESERLKASRKN